MLRARERPCSVFLKYEIVSEHRSIKYRCAVMINSGVINAVSHSFFIVVLLTLLIHLVGFGIKNFYHIFYMQQSCYVYCDS